ncbi:hypothetical protein BH24DEI2_BH24DEI2_07490 [soil metagenome]
MAQTVVGLYDHISQARDTVEDLVDAGFKRDQISFTANASAAEYGKYFDEEGQHRADMDHGADYDDDEMTSGEGAAAGAGIGATIGGLGGLLMGLGLLAVPGVGPALAAGPIVSALVGAGIGAAAGGLMGALVNHGVPEEEAGYYSEGVRRGGSLVMLTVEDDRVDDVERVMNMHNPVDIDERAAAWKEEGFEEYDAKAEPYTADQVIESREKYAIPIVEEDVKVGKREVQEGGKRIRSYIRETPVEEKVTLRDEEVHVERRPVDRAVTDADAAFEEKTIEMTESHEEAVVSKQARVVEEVVIDKEANERTETVRDTVCRTEVEVEDIGMSDRAVEASGYDSDMDEYRKHYTSTFSSAGRDYEYYEPAYRFGSRLAHEDNAKGMSWNDMQSDAQRRWEERNPGTWSDYSDAVRYSYDRENNRA